MLSPAAARGPSGYRPATRSWCMCMLCCHVHVPSVVLVPCCPLSPVRVQQTCAGDTDRTPQAHAALLKEHQAHRGSPAVLHLEVALVAEAVVMGLGVGVVLLQAAAQAQARVQAVAVAHAPT